MPRILHFHRDFYNEYKKCNDCETFNTLIPTFGRVDIQPRLIVVRTFFGSVTHSFHINDDQFLNVTINHVSRYDVEHVYGIYVEMRKSLIHIVKDWWKYNVLG